MSACICGEDSPTEKAAAEHARVCPAVRTCDICGDPIMRRRWPNGHLEDPKHYYARKACSPACWSRRSSLIGIADTPNRMVEIKATPAWAGIEKRFWSYVEKGEGCWLWVGSRRGNGYGQLNITYGYRFKRCEKAHRVSFLIANDWLPGLIMHTCDNPPCVNPSHLRAGTVAENQADMARKGRSPHLKVTPDIRARVLELDSLGWNQCQIVRELGVIGRTSVARIIKKAATS